MKWLALMPLRGGSKSIKKKNIREMAGRPLFVWSLEAAIQSACFDRIYVASDCPYTRDLVVDLFGDAVYVIDRSNASASDTASSELIMLELQAREQFDVLALIQATSPLTRSADFVAAKQRYVDEDCDSLLSAVSFQRFLWNGSRQPINYDPRARPRRQDAPPQYLENGAFYFTASATLAATRCRVGKRVGIHIMEPVAAFEIDEPSDWIIVEQLLLQRRDALIEPGPWSRIEALVVDVDGTLTDAGMYYGADGEVLKKFNTHDANGLAMLRDAGVLVCAMTAEDSPAVAARMRKLNIGEYYPGVHDKLNLLRRRASAWGIALNRVGFVGDDIGDLKCIEHVGASFCPSDAVGRIRASVDHVCTLAGGKGAVREVCELLLASRN